MKIGEKGILYHVIYEDEKPKHKLLVKGVKTNKALMNKEIRWWYHG